MQYDSGHEDLVCLRQESIYIIRRVSVPDSFTYESAYDTERIRIEYGSDLLSLG